MVHFFGDLVWIVNLLEFEGFPDYVSSTGVFWVGIL
jgi:hypothetical protein